MKKVIVGCMCGMLLLGVIAMKYQIPGATVLVIDSEWSDPYDPCDPKYDNLYDPPAAWLMSHGNSLGSMLTFNVAYARTRADKNFQLLSRMNKKISDFDAFVMSQSPEPDPNE